jgi:hypothetical protein
MFLQIGWFSPKRRTSSTLPGALKSMESLTYHHIQKLAACGMRRYSLNVFQAVCIADCPRMANDDPLEMPRKGTYSILSAAVETRGAWQEYAG